ncbi:DNRLRE domain-containing protein [Paenibacillus sp. FSL H7-0714]|uniref:CBM96 family carbohydrate-binding protein n=1 Tax=Paenibacillus sp. FSL H7-0714 TaxID=2954735 RepID=UPI0030F5BD62
MFNKSSTKASNRILGLALSLALLHSLVLPWPAPMFVTSSIASANTAPTVVQLNPLEDTYVNAGGNASKNYGTSNQLIVKNYNADINLNRQTYLKFDLSSITGEIGTAKIKVYAIDTENSTIGVQAYGMEDDTWEEQSVTWNNKPDINHYLSSANVGKTASWQEWDVTAFVKQQKAADGIASLALIQQAAQGHSVSINSRENIVNQPYLDISSNRTNANAPSWQGGGALSVTNITESGLQLEWSTATDPVGVTGYTVYRNGSILGTVNGTTTSYTVSGLQLGQNYTFKVEAGNAQNQWSNDGPYVTAATPTTKLIQTRPGNVYTNSEPIQFKVRTARPSVAWSVYDYQGAFVSEGVAPTVHNEAIWTVPHSTYGYFTLHVRADLAGSDPVLIKTPFTVLATRDATGNEHAPFGVSTHLHRFPQAMTPDIVKLMKDAGIRMVRGGYEWPGIERQQGNYTFTPQPDYYMNMLDSDDFDFLYVSGYTNPNYDNNSTPYTDAGRTGFANYMKAYVDHYQGQMDAVEVYNEFYGSFGDRGNGPADSKPEFYYPLLKKTYETIKPMYPELPVLGTSTVGNLKWIEDVLKLGGMSYMDGFSIHPYLYPGAPEGYETQIADLKNLILKYNNGNLKPIWINETGWPTQLDARGVDEKTQANYLLRAYVVAIANGVDQVVWYDLINDGIQNINEDNFGLLRNPNDPLGSLTPKPAYTSFATMTRILNNVQFVARDVTEEDIRSYTFDKNGEPVRVLWTTSTSTPVVIRTPSPIQITDMMGNTHTYTPYNGNVFVTLSNEPFFVAGEVRGIEKDSTFTLTSKSSHVGDSMSLALETDNKMSDDFDFNLVVEGQHYSVSTPSGQKTTETISVPSGNEPGTRLITGVLMNGSERVGLLRSSASTLPSYNVQVRPTLNESDSSKALMVTIKNESTTKPIQINKVEWRFGTQSGSEVLNVSIPADASTSVKFPLSAISLGVSSTIKVTVNVDGFDPYTYTGSAEFNPVPLRSVAVDGVLDPDTAASASPIDLSKGTVKMTGYQGAGDLSGNVWISYDTNQLYLSAKVKDNVHYSSFLGADIWNNDSIQFAIANGLPGEEPYWYEIGISQTPDGPQIYSWNAPPGVIKGPITNGQLAITRDQEQNTIYELSLPWSEVAPIKPEKNGNISFSLLVNDNDGSGRKGFIEWGGGIGDGKLSSKFRSMQWIVTDMTPPTTIASLEGTERNGWYMSSVQATLSATDDKSDVASVVYSLDGGKIWLPYTIPLTFEQDGMYTLLYRSMDRAGNVEANQKITFRIDKTTPTASIVYSTTEPTKQEVIATMTASEPVTITNNEGADSYTFKENGIFTFEFVDAAGNTGTAKAEVSNIVANASGGPGKPELSSNNGHNTGLIDGTYDVKMNMWWGNNGTTYKLYENDALIDTQTLKDASPQAQSTVTSVTYKANGTYRYIAELTNAFGTTRSNILTVRVTDADPGQPVLSHDNWNGDGTFKVSMNMWWGTNGSSYRLYENGVLIDTQTLTNKTPQAQSAVTEIRDLPAGMYEYRCELVNEAGVTSSNTITVHVQ